MEEAAKLNTLIVEKEETSTPLEVTHSSSGRDRHLEGLSEDQKRIIRLMANIFVQSVLNLSKK